MIYKMKICSKIAKTILKYTHKTYMLISQSCVKNMLTQTTVEKIKQVSENPVLH